ncbi:hypothetical protein CANARDRAFT_181499, partial [[Candida] arabinofermentans NRRL YB-2248]
DLDTPLVGTCQTLEKKYLRLTSQPIPSTVRPLNILRKTLKLLIDKYLEGASYNYLCDQFKSMRQDLTVQHIKNEFTVSVYQYHCKLAIQFEDLGEFNQCQSQLRLLYEGSSSPLRLEFYSYRILYYIITNNLEEAFDLKLQLIDEGVDLESNIFLRTSFRLVESVLLNDYFQFFSLIKEFRFLNSIIMKERIKSLAIICRSYKKIVLGFIKENLLFDHEDDLLKFLRDHELEQFVLQESVAFFDCSKSRFIVEALREKIYKKIDIKGQ